METNNEEIEKRRQNNRDAAARSRKKQKDKVFKLNKEVCRLTSDNTSKQYKINQLTKKMDQIKKVLSEHCRVCHDGPVILKKVENIVGDINNGDYNKDSVSNDSTFSGLDNDSTESSQEVKPFNGCYDDDDDSQRGAQPESKTNISYCESKLKAGCKRKIPKKIAFEEEHAKRCKQDTTYIKQADTQRIELQEVEEIFDILKSCEETGINLYEFNVGSDTSSSGEVSMKQKEIPTFLSDYKDENATV